MSPIEWIFAAAALATAIGVLWRPVKAGAKLIRSLSELVDDWKGVTETKDENGRVIRPGRTGAAAVIEEIRGQVSNTHATNLRDDLDQLHAEVQNIRIDVQAHIAIAKAEDQRRDDLDKRIIEDISALRERYAPQEGLNG